MEVKSRSNNPLSNGGFPVQTPAAFFESTASTLTVLKALKWSHLQNIGQRLLPQGHLHLLSNARFQTKAAYLLTVLLTTFVMSYVVEKNPPIPRDRFHIYI